MLLPTHCDTSLAPRTRDVVPLGHGVHSVDPFSSLYVPFGQRTQEPIVSSRPVGENVPALHFAAKMTRRQCLEKSSKKDAIQN